MSAIPTTGGTWSSSYVQYDTVSQSVGVNTRLQWRFVPVGDLFVVYNHNVQSIADRWQLDSNQLLVKLQHAWRMQPGLRDARKADMPASRTGEFAAPVRMNP